MSFRHSNPELHSYRLPNMSKDGSVFNGSGVKTHSCDNSDTNLHTLYEGGNLSRNCPSTTRKTNHMRREADPANALAASAPSSPSLQSGVTNAEFKRISKLASDLETFLRRKGRNEIPTAYDLHALWFASRETPITKKTLGELDLQKLYRCPTLRHDLNFESELQFSRRSEHTAGGKEKQVETQHYWDAIEIELALYAAYLEELHLSLRSDSLLDAHCSFPKPKSLEYVPQRLEVMIQEICQIVKSLVPPTKWAVVCSRLNHGLFIQEIEHGQCDIENLFCWVGELLLESCAPSRDTRIAGMIKTISQGSRDKDAHVLRRGLQDLFSIFEMMKLDAANYRLQLLRDFMISRSVEDERDQIIWWMQNGWDVSNWLLPHPTTSSSKPSFSTFITKFISLITQPPSSSTSSTPLPTALTLDHTRIHALRSAFQLLTLRASCTRVLASTLHYLGHPTPFPSSSSPSSNDHHISTLITSISFDPTLSHSHCPTSQRDALVLGIASHAYDRCSGRQQGERGWVPSPEVLGYVEGALDALTTESDSEDVSGGGMSVRGVLAERLGEMVEKEMQAVKGLDVGGLAARYASSSSSTNKRAGLATGRSVSVVEPGSLEDVARRVAHVAVLHWKVWAPVLYLSCGDYEGSGRDGGDVEPILPLL